jgi:ketosteroid isomerase-like protein
LLGYPTLPHAGRSPQAQTFGPTGGYCADDVAGERGDRARAFEAFLGGDQERTVQLVDPEVEFHGTVGGLQEGQIARGQSQIDETFEAEDLEAWEERRLEAEEFIDAGDAVVVLLHEYPRGKGSGVELELETAVVVAVSGGRVVRIQGYMDREAALEAVALSE